MQHLNIEADTCAYQILLDSVNEKISIDEELKIGENLDDLTEFREKEKADENV